MCLGCFRVSLKMNNGDVLGKRKGSDLIFKKVKIRWALIIIIIILGSTLPLLSFFFFFNTLKDININISGTGY